jgi:hypothetical protein
VNANKAKKGGRVDRQAPSDDLSQCHRTTFEGQTAQDSHDRPKPIEAAGNGNLERIKVAQHFVRGRQTEPSEWVE